MTGLAADPGRSHRRASISTLAFAFWFIWSVRSLPIFLVFQDNPAFGTAVASAITGLFAFVMLVVYLHVERPTWPLAKVALPIGSKFLLTYVLWIGLSVLWAAVPSKATAFFYWATLATDIFIVYLLCLLGDVESVAVSSLKGIVLGAIVYALVALGADATAGMGRLGNAEFLHPNGLGNLMARGSLLVVYLAASDRGRPLRRLMWALCLIIMLYTLLSTISKTAIVGFAAAILIYMLSGKIGIGQKVLIVFLIFAISLGLSDKMAAYWYEYNYPTFGVSAFDTLSGRTMLWDETWQLIKRNPIWGYGVLSFRETGPTIGSFRPVHAHNELLEVWYSTGIVGVVLAILTYLSFILQIVRSRRLRDGAPQRALALAVVVYALIRGLTEANPVALEFPVPLMLLMFLWVPRAGYRRRRRSTSVAIGGLARRVAATEAGQGRGE